MDSRGPRAGDDAGERLDLSSAEGGVHGGGGEDRSAETAERGNTLEDEDEDVLREALHWGGCARGRVGESGVVDEGEGVHAGGGVSCGSSGAVKKCLRAFVCSTSSGQASSINMVLRSWYHNSSKVQT